MRDRVGNASGGNPHDRKQHEQSRKRHADCNQESHSEAGIDIIEEVGKIFFNIEKADQPHLFRSIFGSQDIGCRRSKKTAVLLG